MGMGGNPFQCSKRCLAPILNLIVIPMLGLLVHAQGISYNAPCPCHQAGDAAPYVNTYATASLWAEVVE